MTHYPSPPAPSQLHPGDTVEMLLTFGTTGRGYTATPCCATKVILSVDDLRWFAYGMWTIERNCRGCGWPYRVEPRESRAVFVVEHPKP